MHHPGVPSSLGIWKSLPPWLPSKQEVSAWERNLFQFSLVLTFPPDFRVVSQKDCSISLGSMKKIGTCTSYPSSMSTVQWTRTNELVVWGNSSSNFLVVVDVAVALTAASAG